MSKKPQGPHAPPVTGRPPDPAPANRPLPPSEPIEVLGRHKNAGQKDHKGAR